MAALSLSLALRANAGLWIDVDLSRQAAFLVRDGKPIASSPISSGKPGHSTPRGTFTVVQKDLNHLSATYGIIVDQRGRVLVADANSGMSLPSGARFIRAPMPYFLGFTPRHGLHAGRLPGYPASHGCVRMPANMARLFFENVPLGTTVRVHGEAR
jgi:lipoprotein-anchoring transpeptidase ErfK/SrfK